MTERELLALMAAALYRDEPTNGARTQEQIAVEHAMDLLAALDRE